MELTIELEEIKFGKGSHLLATVWVNGFIARMIVDTGASETIFDERRILNYLSEERTDETVKAVNGRVSSGLGVDTIKLSEATLNKLQIGDLRIYDYKATLMNLDSVARAYTAQGLKPIEGILGSDILTKYKALIDYEKKLLFLRV